MTVAEITSREAVLKAMSEFDRVGRDAFLRRYGFRESKTYRIDYEGKLYDSKAVLGAAHGYQYPERGPLTGQDFSQGPTVRSRLTALGFTVRKDATAGSWDLAPGEEIARKKLHEDYGGNGQGGITRSSSTPSVFVFTDPASGEQHGYYDRWEDGVLHYTGMGQRGDQEMTGANKAVLEAEEVGNTIRVFQGAKGTVKYLGEFELHPDEPWYTARAHESGGAGEREVIMFRLVPAPEARVPAPIEEVTLNTKYRRADENAEPSPRAPFEVDPDKMDRATEAHARLQNLLADTMKSRGCEVLSPGTLDVDFDVAWIRGGEATVAEVKSMTSLNETRQLRLGLGQVLHYRHSMAKQRGAMKAVLFVEHEPTDPEWVVLCAALGVQLIWPETL